MYRSIGPWRHPEDSHHRATLSFVLVDSDRDASQGTQTANHLLVSKEIPSGVWLDEILGCEGLGD